MKKILLFVFITMFCCMTANAQSYHNYSNPHYGFVQIGYLKGSILYRIPSGNHIPFTQLNYIGMRDNMSFYANSQVVVAVNANLTQVCVIVNQNQIWFNYVGSVQTSMPTSTTNMGGSQAYNNTTQSRVKCYFCNGTGRIAKDEHVPQYTTNDYVVESRCNECGKVYYSTYTNHYHINCSNCGGTGYVR